MSAGQSLQVRVYESLDELEKLVPIWEDLLTDLPLATTFSTWEWLAPWWRAFGNEQELMVLAFFHPAEKLIGLAPLSLVDYPVANCLRFRLLRLMGDGSGDSDNLDLPVRSGYEEAFVGTLLDYLESQASRWDLCQLNTLPADSPVANRLEGVLQHRRWVHFAYTRPWSATILPDSWDSYLKQLSAKERGKLAYYTRRLEKKYSVRLVKCAESELPNSLEALFRLHQRRWELQGEPGSFSSLTRRQFYHEISRLFLLRRWLEFWRLDLDGRPVAAQFGFRYRQTVFQLQEGFDPDYSRDAVGYVLRGSVLKQLIAEGVRRYDFLAGEDPSKARWGAVVGTYKDIHFAGPWSQGSLFLRLVHSAGESKKWLRAHLPAPTWSLLRLFKTQLTRQR